MSSGLWDFIDEIICRRISSPNIGVNDLSSYFDFMLVLIIINWIFTYGLVNGDLKNYWDINEDVDF